MRPAVYILFALFCACDSTDEAAVQRAKDLKRVNTKAWVTTHRKLLGGIETVYRDHLRTMERQLPKTIERRSKIDRAFTTTCDQFLERIAPLAEKLDETSLTGDWQLISDVMQIVNGMEFIYRELRTGIESGRFDKGLNARRRDVVERGRVFEQIRAILNY